MISFALVLECNTEYMAIRGRPELRFTFFVRGSQTWDFFGTCCFSFIVAYIVDTLAIEDLSDKS